jgi:general secretion pathway protein D
MRLDCRARLLFILLVTMMSSGCPKAHDELKYASEAERLQDFDAAVGYYERVQKARPQDAHIKIRLATARSEACEMHLKAGREMRAQNNLEAAAVEFKHASVLDPGSDAAKQELALTVAAISAKHQPSEEVAHAAAKPKAFAYADGPPELKLLSHAPINLKMTNDARIVFETIGKLAGLTVIFDPDFPSRRIVAELDNVTLEQAFDVVAIESKGFWKPLSQSIVLIVPDQPQKRRDYDDQVIQTFYLSNVVQAQDLTEIVTGLRQLLDLKRIQQLNGPNAIVIRDTAAKLAVAQKFIDDVDRAKPEVLLQVQVLQARTDLVKNLGLNPGTSASLAFNPACSSSTSSTCTSTSTTSSSSSSSTSTLTLSELKHLGASDYTVTLPGASLTALLTDSSTQIIQNPEIRSVDGQPAKLKIGDRVPVATGSYSTGATTTTTAVSALVNTQYQYIDVGVNVDVTPRIHSNREISLKITVEVSSVTGYSSIGGLQQPIISQRKIEHDIRLKEGEISILGGLFERTDTKSVNGWPGLAKIPFGSYFFSQKDKELQENEVLIVLTPRIVRLPELTFANLRALYTGSENNVQLRPAAEVETAGSVARTSGQDAMAAPGKPTGEAGVSVGANNIPVAGRDSVPKPRLHFEPRTVNIKAGEAVTVKLVTDNVNDLFSLPVLFEYDPKVVSIEEVRHGSFFSDGGQEIAVVQQIDKERGHAIVSATRPPNVAGVTGSGTILEIVLRAVAPGTSTLAIPGINAKTSKQTAIEFLTDGATIRVSP